MTELTTEHIRGLELALGHCGGTHTIQDVADAIASGDAQIWVEPKAVIVSEVVVSPQCLTLHFWLAAGAMDEVVALTHRVLEWGRGQGCQRATATGRKGWARAMQSEGWKPTLVLLEREL